MSALTIRLPDELKERAMRLARKKKISFNALVRHWLEPAVFQDETIEWMKRRLRGLDRERIVAEFGQILEKSVPGREPDLAVIEKAAGKRRRKKWAQFASGIAQARAESTQRRRELPDGRGSQRITESSFGVAGLGVSQPPQHAPCRPLLAP